MDMNRDLLMFAALEQRRGPSVREFASAIGATSTSVAWAHFAELERAGLIELIPDASRYASRNYRLTEHALALIEQARAQEAEAVS